MKPVLYMLFSLVLLTSCKSDTSKTPKTVTENELNIVHKIANAHGFENWKNVAEIKFTFRVDRDSIKGNARSWIWQPKKGAVTQITKSKSVSYNRNEIDSSRIGIDRAFINDKFWLLNV